MPLEPLSLISTIIGFISFFIAVLTWVNVFWSAFFQLNSAPREVVDNLSSLRQRLYEERTHARRTRKRCNPTIGEKTGASHGVYWDGGPAKVMNDVLKDLIRDFKKLERPFLIPPHNGREKDLEWSYNATQTYYNCDLGHRIKWIQNSKGVMDCERRLNALQIRRTAVETTENQLMLADIMGMLRRTEDMIDDIENRL